MLNRNLFKVVEDIILFWIQGTAHTLVEGRGKFDPLGLEDSEF